MRDRELYQKILGVVPPAAIPSTHVARHLGDAVDRVRRLEHNELKAETINPLTDTRYL